LRIGNGYDIHHLVAGRPPKLGGATIPCDKGLHGHSDGDVLCHAISDALLGASALGDIGMHFPPRDHRYLNADSLELLKQVMEKLRKKRYKVVNVDSIVICEQPKLTPHFAVMRTNLSKAMGIELDQVSVKAKTSEGIGELGRGDAMAAYAVALIDLA